MIYILAPLGFAYFTIGFLWTLNLSVKDNLKPVVRGEALMMILFLPFTIVLLIGYTLSYISLQLMTNLIESKWWNKKL